MADSSYPYAFPHFLYNIQNFQQYIMHHTTVRNFYFNLVYVLLYYKIYLELPSIAMQLILTSYYIVLWICTLSIVFPKILPRTISQLCNVILARNELVNTMITQMV